MPVATEAHHRRIAEMTFASVHPVDQVERKGRTQAELQEVLTWLTGYSAEDIASHIRRKTTFFEFFAEAQLNPKATLVTGVICGYRIEALDNEPDPKRTRVGQACGGACQGVCHGKNPARSLTQAKPIGILQKGELFAEGLHLGGLQGRPQDGGFCAPSIGKQVPCVVHNHAVSGIAVAVGVGP